MIGPKAGFFGEVSYQTNTNIISHICSTMCPIILFNKKQ